MPKTSNEQMTFVWYNHICIVRYIALLDGIGTHRPFEMERYSDRCARGDGALVGTEDIGEARAVGARWFW